MIQEVDGFRLAGPETIAGLLASTEERLTGATAGEPMERHRNLTTVLYGAT